MASSYSEMQTLVSGIPSWVSARQAALMVCRSWVLSDSFGKQEGKQYILSDNGGFVVQGVVHCDNPSCKMCTLVEGEIYNFADYQLVPNTDSIQFRKQGMNILDVSRCSNVIHLTCPPHGFIRHPVQLVALEDIERTDEKYHIDVMGRVIAVGVSRLTNRGNSIVDCHIINRRGTNVRIMLWNEAASSFLGYEEKNWSDNICIFTYMDVREYEACPLILWYLQERAILTPLNEDADRINHQMFAEIQGQEKTYHSADEVCLASTDKEDQEQMYSTEFLNSLNFPGMPPHELSLKEGLPIMMLRNVNPTKGLCNGTRLIITKIGVWIIEAKIITGAQIGTTVLIPRITMSSTKSKWPFVLKRRQYPIKPCFAMTINKSQGQSLKHVGLYLPKPVFCHGQLYVAMSRVTDPDGLKIVMHHTKDQPRNRTKNIVFKEAFNHLGITNEAVVHQGIYEDAQGGM